MLPTMSHLVTLMWQLIVIFIILDQFMVEEETSKTLGSELLTIRSSLIAGVWGILKAFSQSLLDLSLVLGMMRWILPVSLLNKGVSCAYPFSGSLIFWESSSSDGPVFQNCMDIVIYTHINVHITSSTFVSLVYIHRSWIQFHEDSSQTRAKESYESSQFMRYRLD